MTFASPGHPWSFVASWDNLLPVHSAIGSGVRVEASLEVTAGELELGFVAADQRTFTDKVELDRGRHRVVLQTPEATAALALVLRNRANGVAARVVVSSIDSFLDRRAGARQRGFLAKDAMEDLKDKLQCRDPRIVDVGANVGDTVERFLGVFPEARILALEPHPESFERLRLRFANRATVDVRNLALGNHGGQATMYSYTNSAINALSPVASDAIPLLDGQVVPTSRVTVPLTTLPDFLRREGLDQIDILKLDTQGHELEIIRSAAREMAAGKVKYVLTELIFASLYADQARSGEVISTLEQCGFKLFDFYDFVYHPEHGLKWGDALFAFVGAVR